MTKAKQVEMEFGGRGGKRRGAGRKPQGERARVTHAARPEHKSRFPLHVTLRLADGLPSLRTYAAQQVLRDVLRAVAEESSAGLRLVHFSAQSNHLHLIGEAEDKLAISRGMQGFLVRLAKALNRAWNRAGSVFTDRYHSRALQTPREVRNVLAYVLCNARKHGKWLATLLDPCSSAAVFDGWREQLAASREPLVLAKARTWLLTIGWRRHGLLSVRGT